MYFTPDKLQKQQLSSIMTFRFFLAKYNDVTILNRMKDFLSMSRYKTYRKQPQQVKFGIKRKHPVHIC